MTAGQRIKFNQPPSEDELFFAGQIYEPDISVAQIISTPQCLNTLEADIAIVSYQAQRRTWRLLRDFGQTPLYYAPLSDGFVWSFTYCGLLSMLETKRPDEATMFDYLATHYRYIFRSPTRTFHHGVFLVPAGSYLDINLEGQITTTPWLDLSLNPSAHNMAPDEATEEFMALLRHSVKKRVLASKAPAFTVSSGLDSSTVTALASLNLPQINAFSVGYEGEAISEFDETEGIKALMAGRNWNWTHLTLDCPDLVAETKNLINLSQSPIPTVTWLAYYLMVRRLTGFSEIFNGLGGDESLAGEFVHFFYFFADLKNSGPQSRLNKEIYGWMHLHDHPIFKKNKKVLADFWQRNIDFNSGDMRVDLNVYQANWRFFNRDWLNAYGSEMPPMPRPYPGFLSNRLYQELTFETTPPTLWGLWRTNELFGLKGVSPFMTPRLFKLCLSLPSSLKYDSGVTKALLRRGLSGVLPESIRLNPQKVGFNAPINQWFKNPKVRAETLELLHYGPLTQAGFLKKGAAETIFEEHNQGVANHMMLLWPLLNGSLFLSG
ncbi:MAG: asparagine synthase-related protein [Candidatus Adiutrix sp.]